MRTLLLFLGTFLLFTSCSDDNAKSDELNQEQIAGLFDAASIIKDMNQQMLSLVMQYPNIHGVPNSGAAHAPLNDGSCPLITPDPSDVRDYFPVNLSFNFVEDGDGCVPVGSSVRYKGIFFLDIYANVCLPGGGFRFHGENFWLGDDLTLSVDQVDVTQTFRSMVGDTVIFDTDIEKLVCLNNGLLTNDLSRKRYTAVKDVIGGVSKYVDRKKDTDLNDFITLTDDVVIFEFEELTAYDRESGDEMVCKNGKLYFGVSCTCPVAGSFEVVSPTPGIINFDGNDNCVDGNYTFNGESYQMACK